MQSIAEGKCIVAEGMLGSLRMGAVQHPFPRAERFTMVSRPASNPTVTLRALAAAAGVHMSTASRALDPARRHLIAPDVVARIEGLARDLGYRPNRSAASLRTGRSRLVGVLVPDIANPVFSPIVSAISEALGAEGYSTIVADVGSDPERQRRLVDDLVSRRVDGLVLATVSRDDAVLRHCLDLGLAVVLVNRTDDARTVSSVASDDRRGMALAVDHLVGLGHRKIGHLGGPERLSTGAARRQGFVDAMAAAGLVVETSALVEASTYDREAGEAAADRLLVARPDLTAIVAANDLLALGALRALRRRGRACPTDISLVGHNDMPLVDQIDPPLTTVRIGPRAMGAEAARLLIGIMSGEDRAIRRIVLEPALVVRGSTRALQQPAAR